MTVTDIQLYFAVGLPVFAVLMSMIVAVLQHNSIGARLMSFESNMNARFASLENRFLSLEARFDILSGNIRRVS